MGSKNRIPPSHTISVAEKIAAALNGASTQLDCKHRAVAFSLLGFCRHFDSILFSNSSRMKLSIMLET